MLSSHQELIKFLFCWIKTAFFSLQYSFLLHCFKHRLNALLYTHNIISYVKKKVSGLSSSRIQMFIFLLYMDLVVFFVCFKSILAKTVPPFYSFINYRYSEMSGVKWSSWLTYGWFSWYYYCLCFSNFH
jgi:hypothetical protein